MNHLCIVLNKLEQSPWYWDTLGAYVLRRYIRVMQQTAWQGRVRVVLEWIINFTPTLWERDQMIVTL